jgi:hypothetical protein
MSYFRELPDIEYQSPFSDKISSKDYVTVKNLFRRVKIRDDFKTTTSLFTKYEIAEGARPDTVAQEFYGNSTYDWIVLLSANIINVREQWPLSDRDVYRFAEEKYGIQNLDAVKYHETIEVKDSVGRLILPGGKIVDDFIRIPRPKISVEVEIDNQDFTVDNSNKTASGELLYLYDYDSISTTNLYGSFEILPEGNNYRWYYTFNTAILDLLNFNDGFADASDSIFYVSTDGFRRTITVTTRVTIIPDEYPIDYTYSLSVNNFSNSVSYVTYYDTNLEKEVTQYNITKPVTNSEYEILKNNEKRTIYLLKPIYLQQYINNFRTIMIYDKSSQYVNKKLIRTENTAVTLP